MKLVAALTAAVLLAASVNAQSPSKDKARMRLQLELEIQKAKAQPVASPAEIWTDYQAALAEATRTGKPLFVSVGLDCTPVCSKLRPDVVTCHVAAIDGVPAGDCFLVMRGFEGKMGLVGRWRGLASETQVRAEITRIHKAFETKNAPACNWSDGT
jgi:hypothetical protein